MKNRLMRTGAALLAGMMLLAGGASIAEERRMGDYIYVPAMSVPGSVGTQRLRVEGVALDGESGSAQVIDSLSGAQFGVYVFSGDGELKPWANPLYPSEPMRIRTGEGETEFTLPQGIEFYLRQESAPQGYLFDETQLYRVEGEEILVTNHMPGELVVRAADTLGRPLAGTSLRVTAHSGAVYELTTDENGEASLLCGEAGVYTVEETAIPAGEFEAIRVLVGGNEAALANAQVSLASRTEVTFEHPASGSVMLEMTLRSVDRNAQTVLEPLSGVRLEILADAPASVVTDAEGRAGVSLLEGQYPVRLTYEGAEEIILPREEAQTIIKSGADTEIRLTAAHAYGRIAVTLECERAVSGGSITFESASGDERFGPYAFDEEGLAVTDLLPAGDYRVAGFEAPQDTLAGEARVGEQQTAVDSAELTVLPGEASFMEVGLLTMEKQTYGLYAQTINDLGETEYALLASAPELTLLGADGEEAAQLTAESGYAMIEALSGEYRLRMDERAAGENGVSAVSLPFTLPSDEEAIVFPCEEARLILVSVDHNGEPVHGARYSVIDSTGAEMIVGSDEDAQAVTPLLTAGVVRIETIAAPQGHDEAQMIELQAAAGEARRVEVVHPAYGTAAMSVAVQGVNERGESVLSALPGVKILLYSVAADGVTLIDTEIELTAGEDGTAEITLEPGMYAAKIDEDSLPQGCTEGPASTFVVENTQRIQVLLTCMDAFGGVYVELRGGELTREELAQVRFELVAEDGAKTPLAAMDAGFYAGGLPAGEYTLRQTQIPQGYTLAKDQIIDVAGGEVTEAEVPLEEYAVLSVSKTGITFNDRMQTYIVPLSGQYGVFTQVEGEMKPYPDAETQMTVWANVTPEQIASGRADTLRLPAAMEGTTYYIREISGASGFAPDEVYHEVTLTAGETRELPCTVSSDRGFFSFTQTDAVTGEHVPGGEYELIDNASRESVLTFTLGDEPYRNAMAVPVGAYTLRQIRAGQGYAMSEQDECLVVIQPYLTQGGTITPVAMAAAKIPEEASVGVIGDMYAANQEGLTLLMIDGAPLAAGETMRVPQMTVRVSSENGERTDIGSIILGGVSDELGGRYAARVEYSLSGGGWQPSDARMTQELTAPVCVSLMDVEDDICAVRVTYINAETGEEWAAGGFNPGQMSLNIEAGVMGEAQLVAEAFFTGEYVYRTQRGGTLNAFARSARREIGFAALGGGEFSTASAGRDGRVTGIVFFDENADGVMSAQEVNRYAGMTVTLMTPSMEVVATTRTDGSGRYEFSGVSGGEYALGFEAGEKLVFSSGEGYSDHVVSGISDKQYGVSALLRFDGDHTDYVVNAGCIYAAHASGTIVEKTADGSLRGFDGLNVDVMSLSAPEDEPIVVMTDDTGAFRLTGLLPGEYEITITLPESYLCRDAQDGVITRRMTLEQGEEYAAGEFMIAQQAAISGGVYVDEDGDGAFHAGAQTLGGVGVSLIAHENGHTEVVKRTQTDENGRYTFDALPDGEYSVLFELGGEWTFTRFGGDSRVYGAVSSSGSTQSFMLMPGAFPQDINAGATLSTTLEVMVFADEHADGLKGVYDVGLAGVQIRLIRQEDGQDAQEVALETDRDGMAFFDGVAPGEYVLAYEMPGAYRATRQRESDSYRTSCVPQTTLPTGRSAPFTLTMGESDAKMYIGALLSGSISGTVYYDNDADARIGEEETACAGVLIELLDADGALLDSRTSDETGVYVFDGLAPGRYSVRFSAQQECGFSGTERSMSRGGVQKSEESVSQTRSLSISAGDKIDAADAGVVRLGSIMGTLFVDSNADCAMGDAEAKLSGVSVHLMNSAARSILASTTTDAQGVFSFDRVTPGTYVLRIDAPEGYVYSGAMQGSPLPLDDVRDGRGYSAAFELLGGAHAHNIGFGLLTQGAISGRVWVDEDYDGYAGEKEDGLRGALVTLSTLEGSVIESKTTIRSGEFVFDGLMPGEYALAIDLGEGYVFTTSSGESLTDRVDQSTASVYLGELAMGGTMDNLMIGAIKPAVVGGVVWLDDDNDGRRADDEAGAAGVSVTLTTLSGEDSGKTATVMTGADGAYLFENVMPGAVELSFSVSEGYAFAKNASGSRRVSCVPMTDALSAKSEPFAVSSGAKRVDMDAGILPVGTITGYVWQDAEYNGTADSHESGVAGAQAALVDAKSGQTVAAVQTDESGAYRIGFVRPGTYTMAFTLPEGMIFTQEGESAVPAADASRAQTERFTVRLGESLSGMNAGAIYPSGVSGRLVVDRNENGLCDGDEPGLEGAVITVMQGGTVITSTKTTPDGAFSVDTLRPGSYRVRAALPEDTLFAIGCGLALEHEDAQEGESEEFTLTMGQKTQIAAVPVIRTATVAGRAWMDENADGRMDEQEAAIENVRAALLDENGSVIRETTADENGEYAFSLLRSGTYAVRFTLGGGVLFADQTAEAGGSSVPVVSGNTGTTPAFTLEQQSVVDQLNVGGILPGGIGDSVFLDLNGNGLQDYREPLLSGVTLELMRVQDGGAMTLEATVTSDAYGYYAFSDLRPGSYVVRVQLEAGDALTARIGAPLGEIDSDVNPETGETDVIDLDSGKVLRNIDVGFTSCQR